MQSTVHTQSTVGVVALLCSSLLACTGLRSHIQSTVQTQSTVGVVALLCSIAPSSPVLGSAHTSKVLYKLKVL